MSRQTLLHSRSATRGPGVVLLASLLAACTPDDTDDPSTEPVPAYGPLHCPVGRAEVEARVEAILGELTLEQRASLMHGVAPLPLDGVWQSTAILQAGVPGLRMLDGPKGVGGSALLNLGTGDPTTCFPAAIGRGATWDVDLERQVGAAIGGELRASGGDTLLAPVVNVAWHPQGGRVQEGYGEDPWLVGQLGSAFVRGVQDAGAVAVAKHFTANHVENTRLDMSANLPPVTLHHTALPAFREVVQQAGVRGVMSAYNKVDGVYAGESEALLTDVLRTAWGFEGFVVSDFVWGTPSTVGAARAGLDLEMPFGDRYGAEVVAAVEEGTLDEAVVTEHARRLLRVQLCAALDTDPAVADPSGLERPEALALARQVATEAAVLLKNDGEALPVGAGASVALLGPLHAADNVGDVEGSSGVRSSDVVSLLEGMEAVAPQAWTLDVVADDPSSVDPADLAATDVAIVVVGLTPEDEGEGQVRFPGTRLGAGDREDLALPRDQDAVVAEVAAVHDRVVVVLMGGSVVDVSPWADDVEAILEVWYPGLQGGHAVADLLSGAASPSGRLPLAWPADPADLPPFPFDAIEADYGVFHGQRHLEAEGIPARYPLGWGLGYTETAWSDAAVAVDDEGLAVSVTVEHLGDREAAEVVQVYARYDDAPPEDAPWRLVGFARVPLGPAEARAVTVPVPWRTLERWSAEAGWARPAGGWTLRVARHAEEDGLTVRWEGSR